MMVLFLSHGTEMVGEPPTRYTRRTIFYSSLDGQTGDIAQMIRKAHGDLLGSSLRLGEAPMSTHAIRTRN